MDNPDRVTYFAATDARGKRVPFGIKTKDRSRHMYIIGKTGMGKSTLLENMAIQDIRNGEGIAFIDPHGETANKLLEYVPADRINDVVYFAPFDLDFPIAFNVMEDVGYDKRHLVVSGLMATFKKIWEDAWSARMEYILTNTLLALLEYPDATLLGVNRMYTDKAYRKKVVDNVKDPVVKDFWVKEFAAYTDRYTQEATPSIQNKIGQFTGNPLIRNIIGQPKSTFDFRDLMDKRKIIIINLSKGQVGETNMRLLGSMLTTRIFLGAMSRAELHGDALQKLPQFYFYVDEFQNFANETFAEILSEARKYHLNLVIAHQYVEQMEDEVRSAVFGNVGTTVAFRVGPFDAETLETVFMPEFVKDDLVNLGLRQIYLTLMINGVGSRPFSAVTLPPIEPPPVIYRDQVIAASRAQFGSPREKIEEYIFNELTLTNESNGEPEPPPKNGTRRPPPARDSAPSGAPPREQRTESVGPSPDRPREHDTRSSGTRLPEPRTDRPRENDRSREPRRDPQREGSRTPPTKTAEDLRAILRTMTTTSTQSTHKSSSPSPSQLRSPVHAPVPSLKSALSDVLKKELPSATPPLSRAPELKDTLSAVGVRREPRSQESSQPSSAAHPYEVPEETLKALFKDQ